jgi:hypothetical protein
MIRFEYTNNKDPASVEKYDDKFITNNLLLDSGLDVAASYTVIFSACFNILDFKKQFK